MSCRTTCSESVLYFAGLSHAWQATLKELGARHDLDVKKLRKRAKAAEQQAQQMGAELADLRLR